MALGLAVSPVWGLLQSQGGPATIIDIGQSSLSSNIAFTRADAVNGSATLFNSSGIITPVNANIPRFDSFPVSRQPRGLLIEGARTNLITQSEQFVANTGVTVASNNATSPAGTLTADTMTADTAASQHQSLPSSASVSTTTGLVYVHSVFAKAGTHNFFQLYGLSASFGVDVWANFNLSSGTVGSVGAATTASIQNVGNGWYRCVIVGTATATATSGTPVCAIISSATAARGESWATAGTESIQLWGAQTGQTTFASSYIPTTGTAATRALDSAVITNLSTIGFNSSEGTFVVEFENPYAFSAGFPNRNILSFGTDNNNNARIVFDITGTIRMASTTGGVLDVNQSDGGGVRGAGIYKVAMAYRANDFAICTNGATPIVDSLCVVPPVTSINIGQSIVGDFQLFGWIRRILYVPTRLPNSQLQSLTL